MNSVRSSMVPRASCVAPTRFLAGRGRLWVYLVLAGVLLAGCDDGPAEPSLLDAPRVLAIRGEPAALVEGEDITIEAIGFELGAIEWDACPAPFVPGFPATCPIAPIPVGSGNPVTVQVPAGVSEVWVRATVEGALTTIRRFGSEGPATNPEIAALVDDDGAPLPTLAPGAEQPVRADLVGEAGDERRVVTFYSTLGGFDPFRRFEEESSLLLIPEDAEPGEVTLIAIVRDADGGVGALQTVVEVAP